MRIDLLFENPQLVSDPNDFMKEHFERNLEMDPKIRTVT
jgi:hypothetical protein